MMMTMMMLLFRTLAARVDERRVLYGDMIGESTRTGG